MAILVLIISESGTDPMHSGKITGALRIRKGTSRPGMSGVTLASWLVFSLLLLGHVPMLRAQSNFLPEAAAPIATTSTPRTLGGLAANDIIAKMTEKNRQRNQRLQNYS